MTLAQTAVEQNDERGPFIATLSGAYFFVNECNIEDIPIDDIAHALAMNVRFNGHISRPYSVAEHSCHIADMAEDLTLRATDDEVEAAKAGLWGLMHDATEAFVPDIPRPFKHLIGGFQEFEDTLAKKMAKALNLPWPMPEVVKYLDAHIVRLEAESLFPAPPDWVYHYEDISETAYMSSINPEEFGCKTEEAIKKEFLTRYDRYERYTRNASNSIS